MCERCTRTNTNNCRGGGGGMRNSKSWHERLLFQQYSNADDRSAFRRPTLLQLAPAAGDIRSVGAMIIIFAYYYDMRVRVLNM